MSFFFTPGYTGSHLAGFFVFNGHAFTSYRDTVYKEKTGQLLTSLLTLIYTENDYHPGNLA